MWMYRRASELEAKNMPFAIVTIIGHEGTVPRSSGRMLVEEDGTTTSTIGGHRIENEAVKAALEALQEGKGRIISAESGHGRLTLMIDVVNKIKKAYIIGYGYVGKAIARLLHDTGYAVYIYDTESVECSWAAGIRIGGNLKELLSGVVLDKHSALVVTVHGGDEILSDLDFSRAFYVGMITSRTRIIPDKRIAAPIGLDIAAETPEEIAIAVTAEIMQAYGKTSGMTLSERRHRLVIVRGAGDLATGTIIKLWRAGYDVLALETAQPTQIRRSVSFAEAVYEGSMTVDGVRAVLIHTPEEAFHAFDENAVPVLVDPEGLSIACLKPGVVVDAIIAKKNLGTNRDMAPLVIALGPGFTAGVDADAVIETKRGHRLGRIIREGIAIPNTGEPGNIGGYTTERVIRSGSAGVFRGVCTFGDIVKKGDVIAYVDAVPLTATIDGMIRGMLHSGLYVTEGFKVADIDPRGSAADCTTPSDKAYAIAGGVLECVDSFYGGRW